MNIFDDITRKDPTPPTQDDVLFAYLNRSDRPEAHRVRQNVEEWFNHFPSDKRGALITRFRSSTDVEHLSAFFELFLHEFLLRRGCKIIAVEPVLQNKKTPDFLVESREGDRFYVEAVMVTGQSDDEVKASLRLSPALAAIDAIECPNHSLDLRVRTKPTAPIKIKHLKKELRQWIASLPEGDASKEAAPFIYTENGAHIRLRAWPRHNKGPDARAIGVTFSNVWRGGAYAGLKEAITKKAAKYNSLDHPYIVAVNFLTHFFHDVNMVDVMFGTSNTEAYTGPNGELITREIRKKDGVWTQSGRNSKPGLSAVLAMNGIDTWHFAGRHALLVCNPKATAPLPPIGLGVDEVVEVDRKYQRVAGTRLFDIFGLPTSWPQDPPNDDDQA